MSARGDADAPRDPAPRRDPAPPRDVASDRPPRTWGSLCEECVHVRTIRSGRGSVFLMCRVGVDDPSWPKYPPQPVRACPRFERWSAPT